MTLAADAKYLFLGVGGMGMAPLACWMSHAGYSVSGYDSFLSERMRKYLVKADVHLYDFLFDEHLKQFDQVIHSSAVREGHPLLDAAKRLGIPCFRRGELLARIASEKKFIAIAGSHGKTTTSGMIAYGIRTLGIDANYILGGLFDDDILSPSYYSESEWMIAEVDESDGTINGFEPAHSVILNMDWDHADHYTNEKDLIAAFSGLASRTEGIVWAPDATQIDGILGEKSVTYAFDGNCADLDHFGLNRGNWAAAMSVLQFLMPEISRHAINEFPGMARRQSVLHEEEGLLVIEDYAHHPTEIEALLRDLRQRAKDRRLEVVFQSHRYTRTKQFGECFAKSLDAADRVWLLPVYGAHEHEVAGGRFDDLFSHFRKEPPVVLDMGADSIERICREVRREPTLLAFVGAGDVEQFASCCVSTLRCGKGAAFTDFLRQRTSDACVIKEDEPLAKKTTMRVGGSARYYLEPTNRADLQVMMRACSLFGVESFCLGRGSNLVVSDAGFEGAVIRFSANAWKHIELLEDGRIWAAAGCRLKELCGFAAKSGLSGFEFLEGIPGSVGGSLRMNAGAMGRWIFDIVERVQFFDEFGGYQDWKKEQFKFGYRKVEEISRGIALGAIFEGNSAREESEIRDQIDTYANTRKGSQPRGASAGCIFKNPEGNYAGKLIDEFGLKGMRVGDAEVSDVHGNFIINRGEATAADIIELVSQVRSRIQQGSGYDLEPEVLLVGQSWDELLNGNSHE